MSAARTAASLRRTVWFGVVVSLLLAVGAGGWAATARLASAVIAPGTLVLADGVAIVRAAVAGSVASVVVRDGDVVAAGDVLVRLGTAGNPGDRAMLDAAIADRQARLAALIAVRDGAATLTVPPALAEDPSAAALAEARRTLAADIDARAAMEAAARTQREARTAQIAALRARAASAAGGAGSAVEAEIAAAKAAAADAALARLQSAAAERNGREKAIEALRSDLGALAARRDQHDRNEAALVLRAPVAGTVFELAVNGPGALVRAGETVATIVPTGAPLIVEARIDPLSVDEVHVGQAASVSLNAFNARTARPRDGTVAFVGAQTSRAGANGPAFYTVRIALAPVAADAGTLRPGMPVTAFITTGTQTAAAYLLRPLTEQIARAWRES